MVQIEHSGKASFIIRASWVLHRKTTEHEESASSKIALVLRSLFAPIFEKSAHENQQVCDCSHFVFDIALEHPNQADTLR